jgi:GNAT superfamily N-acetyltransferase
MVEVRAGQPDDAAACVKLAAALIGERGTSFVEQAIERGNLLVASLRGDVAGMLAYRTDWFACTFVTLVVVHRDHRRKGIARALFHAVEHTSPSPRLFSSTEETNVVSIRMHSALGFTASGHVDNLPQGFRELLFYKRLHGDFQGAAPRYLD